MSGIIALPVSNLNMASLFWFIALIISLTVHEFAHALTADRLGDPTPRSFGRLSLNPLRHLDPLGTIMLLIARFGWGRPVPIDPYNFRSPRRDELLVALSGPASNFLLAILTSFFSSYSPILYILVVVNLSLAIFNLLPLPPLDGSKILLNLLPPEQSSSWATAFDQYGPFLLAALLFSNFINLIISPIIGFFLRLLLPS